MEWQIEEREGDLEIRFGGELFGLLPADDRALLTDPDGLCEWVERELLAHADRVAELLKEADADGSP